MSVRACSRADFSLREIHLLRGRAKQVRAELMPLVSPFCTAACKWMSAVNKLWPC